MIDVLHRGDDGFDHRQARLARPEDDVGLQIDVAARRERGGVVVVALGRQREHVRAVRELLVHVDHHRILAPGLVSSRIEDGGLQRHALRVLVVDDGRAAPRVLRHEGVGRGDLLRVGERRAADEIIRRVVEILNRIRETFGALRLREPIDALVERNERGHRRRRRRARRDARVAGLLRSHPECRDDDRLRAIDPLLLGIEARVAMSDLTGRAVGQPRRAAAIRLHLPDVQLVVEQHAAVVGRPSGDAERRLLRHRRVRLLVDERRWRCPS